MNVLLRPRGSGPWMKGATREQGQLLAWENHMVKGCDWATQAIMCGAVHPCSQQLSPDFPALLFLTHPLFCPLASGTPNCSLNPHWFARLRLDLGALDSPACPLRLSGPVWDALLPRGHTWRHAFHVTRSPPGEGWQVAVSRVSCLLTRALACLSESRRPGMSLVS